MTRKVLRKVHIEGKTFSWVADSVDLELYPYSEMKIRVFLNEKTKSILYIDPTAWHFELSPNDIKGAIEHGLKNGWKLDVANTCLVISKDESGYVMVPQTYLPGQV